VNCGLCVNCFITKTEVLFFLICALIEIVIFGREFSLSNLKAESFRTSTNLLCPRWDPEDNTELEVSFGSRFGKILVEVRSV